MVYFLVASLGLLGLSLCVASLARDVYHTEEPNRLRVSGALCLGIAFYAGVCLLLTALVGETVLFWVFMLFILGCVGAAIVEQHPAPIVLAVLLLLLGYAVWSTTHSMTNLY